jgi:hypothetical protein
VFAGDLGHQRRNSGTESRFAYVEQGVAEAQHADHDERR